MHAAVRAAFASGADYSREQERTLWRLDTPSPGTVNLYIVSPGEPDLTHLVEQAGWPTTETWDTRDYAQLLESLHDGQRWAFRLTANPTHSGRKDADAKDTQRFGYLREREQVDWLVGRAPKHGFAIPQQGDGEVNLRLHERRTRTFDRGNGKVTLVSATYDGVLDVTDAALFRQALTGGIGHAKAYGCGLLTLARAS